MIDALEEALQSSRHTYDRHVQRKMFVEALHKSGFHIAPIEKAASNPAWARPGMTEAEGEVLDEVAGLTAEDPEGEVFWRIRNEKTSLWTLITQEPTMEWGYAERVRVTPIKDSKE